MKKQVYIMIVVLVALSIIGVIALYVQPSRKQARVFSAPVLGTVKIKDVNKIVLNDNVTLSRSGDIWSFMKKKAQGLVPQPTRQDYVQEFLDVLSSTEKGRVIDSNPTDLGEYNLDNNTKTIVLSDADDVEVLKITMGVSYASFPTHVLQLNDDPAVYKTTDALRSYLDKNNQYWLDLRVFPNGINQEQITAIRINKDDSVITLRNNENTWTYNDDALQKISAFAVVSYLEDIESLSASDFSDARVTDDIKYGTVVLDLIDNQTIEVMVYYLADKYFLTTKGGQNNEIFFLQEYGVNKLFPSAEVFFDTSEESAEDDEENTGAEEEPTDAM